MRGDIPYEPDTSRRLSVACLQEANARPVNFERVAVDDAGPPSQAVCECGHSANACREDQSGECETSERQFARHEAHSSLTSSLKAKSALDPRCSARRANHLTPVQPLLQKYSDFQKTQIAAISFAVLFPQEGRFAVVTDVGSGMRWTRRHHARDERADE